MTGNTVIPFATIKRALEDISVRQPDVDAGTDGKVPALKKPDSPKGVDKSEPAPKPEADVSPDDTPQEMTAEKAAELWAEMSPDERAYVGGVKRACEERGVDPALLVHPAICAQLDAAQ